MTPSNTATADLVRRPATAVENPGQRRDLRVRRAVVSRPDPTGRIVAIVAPLGPSVAAVHLSGGAVWSWPLPLLGLIASAVIARRMR